MAAPQPPAAPQQARGRGRPGKRRQILDAAAAVFLREGFGGASVDAVAAEAKVVKQTVYNHFSDKEELVAAVVTAALDPIAGEFSDVLAETLGAAGPNDLEAALRAFGRRWVRLLFCAAPAALRWQILAEHREYPELGRALREADRGTALQEIAGHLERLAAQGALDLPDATRAARQLRGLLLGEAHTASAYGQVELTDAQVEDVVDVGIDLFLRAYRAGAAQEPAAQEPGVQGPGVREPGA